MRLGTSPRPAAYYLDDRSVMRPITETIELADELTRSLDTGFDVLDHLQGLADRIQSTVPDCMGMSIAWTEQGVAFTLVSSDEEIAVLDGIQYLSGGPSVEAVERGTGLKMGRP